MSITTYEMKDNVFYKHIKRRNGSISTSTIPAVNVIESTPEAFDKAWLMMQNKPSCKSNVEMRLVDLFCGTGPMTLGVVEAARCLGIKMIPSMAIDFNRDAANNYKNNFPTSNVITGDITQYVNGEFGMPFTKEEIALKQSVGKVDFMIAGPPCQGHSDLNNHTRRDDPAKSIDFASNAFCRTYKSAIYTD